MHIRIMHQSIETDCISATRTKKGRTKKGDRLTPPVIYLYVVYTYTDMLRCCAAQCKNSPGGPTVIVGPMPELDREPAQAPRHQYSKALRHQGSMRRLLDHVTAVRYLLCCVLFVPDCRLRSGLGSANTTCSPAYRFHRTLSVRPRPFPRAAAYPSFLPLLSSCNHEFLNRPS
jgi:hypothetical protein